MDINIQGDKVIINGNINRTFVKAKLFNFFANMDNYFFPFVWPTFPRNHLALQLEKARKCKKKSNISL